MDGFSPGHSISHSLLRTKPIRMDGVSRGSFNQVMPCLIPCLSNQQVNPPNRGLSHSSSFNTPPEQKQIITPPQKQKKERRNVPPLPNQQKEKRTPKAENQRAACPAIGTRGFEPSVLAMGFRPHHCTSITASTPGLKESEQDGPAGPHRFKKVKQNERLDQLDASRNPA